MKLDDMKVIVDKLKALLDDPHPGLMTWNGFLAERMTELVNGWNEPKPAKAVETIHDIADSVLADMVRDGCYTRNTRFDAGTHLIVLAVPYDQSEAENLPEAFEAFRELLTSDDWEERNFKVLTVENGQPKVIEVAPEVLAPLEDNNA